MIAHRARGATVYNGECVQTMTTLASLGTTVDSIVTDPLYHLTTVKRFGGNQAPAQYGTDGLYQRASAGFMGKEWDGGDVAFRPETWRACYDLLKPGGYLLAFSGSRTYHRMACAIEDAGFEIRDQLMWLYGTGFPKSHDVSKAIDKRKDWTALPKFQGAVRAARMAAGISQSEAARRCGLIAPGESLGGGGFMWFETGMRIPTRDQYLRLKIALGLGDECDAAFEAAEREVIGQHADGTSPGGFGDHRFTFDSRDITAPATDAARQWDGWGTALKPAHEPIVMARKPLDGTVAHNVLTHGVGAINIDACRVPTTETITATRNVALGSSSGGIYSGADVPGVYEQQPACRFPANVLHDGSDEVFEAFAAYGDRISGKPRDDRGTGGIWSPGDGVPVGPQYGDSGTAARFFYCAKASKRDRAGSKHPTVKPIALIEYLCRMVTPPGGTVLDPFAGSGTLADAWGSTILIERETEYYADILQRLEASK
jgi:site-specific DNA-methyltransferase (adenine-specific)